MVEVCAALCFAGSGGIARADSGHAAQGGGAGGVLPMGEVGLLLGRRGVGLEGGVGSVDVLLGGG